LLRRRSERAVELMAEALASPEPLRAWWELASDPRGTAILVELLAAANHRQALKDEVGKVAQQIRRMQLDALDELLPRYGLDPERFPPALVAASIQGLAFSAVQDQAAGYDTAPDEALAAMDRLVAHLESTRRR